MANPLPPIIVLILAALGALADWKYKRKGGRKPGNLAKILFRAGLILIGAILAITTTLVFISPGGAEEITRNGMRAAVELANLLFFVWELSRWFVRWWNPLSKPTAVP